MELLTSPKTTYLLEADLEILHQESREWLNEISYWRDEIAFFYTLMVKKGDKKFSIENKDELVHIQDEILHMSGKEFGDFEATINQHEIYLDTLLQNNSLRDERVFREKHKIISSEILNFDTRIRKLKKEIFALVKKNHS